MLPGVITPVPPVKSGVKLALLPATIVIGAAVKLEINGTGSTVIVVCCAAAAPPPAGVTVKVYVVVVVGLTLTGVPLVGTMLPGVITPEPPLNTGIKLELDPASIVEGLAPKPLISGGGPVLVVELPPPQPAKSKMATLATSATNRNAAFRSDMPNREEVKDGSTSGRSEQAAAPGGRTLLAKSLCSVNGFGKNPRILALRMLVLEQKW